MDPDAVDDLSAGRAASPAGGNGADGGSAGRVVHGGVEDPALVDFSANTNPYTPDGVARVYSAALSAARSYPADDYYEFRAVAADYVGCAAREVIPTAGGLAALRLAVATTVGPGDRALVPTPSSGEYAREIRLQGGEPAFVPHGELLGTDPSEFAAVLACSPNDPTGDAYAPDRLRAYADRCLAAETPLVVDEAFLGFTDLPSLSGHDGTVALRSLTKLFGLPGLRAGFAVATGSLRDRLDTARPAWGLGTPAAAVGVHCMQASAFVTETRERTAAERERLRERLSDRFEVHPSDAPFLLLAADRPDAVDQLLESARSHGVALRDARTFRGLDRHVRVALRTPEENDRLLDALGV